MSGMVTYEVVPRPGERWTVHREGASPSGGSFPTRDAAVAFARRVCRALRPSRLLIRGADGTVESEETYAVERDPLDDL